MRWCGSMWYQVFCFSSPGTYIFSWGGHCLTPSSDVFVQPAVILPWQSPNHSAGPHIGSKEMPFSSSTCTFCFSISRNLNFSTRKIWRAHPGLFAKTGVILSRETPNHYAGPHTGSEDMLFLIHFLFLHLQELKFFNKGEFLWLQVNVCLLSLE